jgi:hypothetical protein
MKKNDGLKKHHFWILFGLVPLFVLIAVLVVTSSVGGAINAKLADIDSTQKSLSGKNPKSEKLITWLEGQIAVVKKKKTSLWEEHWKQQQDLYTWPKKSKQLQNVEKLNLRFGAPIPEEDFTHDQFKLPEVYLAEYSDEDRTQKPPKPATRGMALTVAPTEFKGGWQNVLRHVTKGGWGAGAPSSEQIWLLMEDIWVQRSLLEAIRSVNAQFAEFTRVKYVRDGLTIDDPAKGAVQQDKLRRRFESKTWAVELEVKEANGKKAIGGRLINLTNRLQLMGVNNWMVLKVWLDDKPGARPFEMRIGGEFVPGAGAVKPDGKPANVLDILEIKPDDLVIPPSIGTVSEIVRVEQVFDTRTVPVRRIEAIALGFPDNRHANAQLKMPRTTENPPLFKGFIVKDGDTSAAPPGGMGMGMGMGMPPGGIPAPVVGGDPRGTGTDTAAARGSGGGSLESIVDANKKRYIDVTNSVRRMPVAVAVIVDQANMQEVLVAFANSPLRFQITQVDWQRFRGKLSDTTGGGGGTGSAGDSGIEQSGMGNFSSDLRISAPPMSSRMPPGGVPTMPPGGIGMFPTPGGTSGMMGYPGSGTLTTVSESQLTSGLVELSIYGVVSLYEKYSAEEDVEKEKDAKEKEAKENEGKDKDGKDKEKDGKDKTPKDADPKKGTDPMPKNPKDPMPKDPMNADPKGTKSGRRARKS